MRVTVVVEQVDNTVQNMYLADDASEEEQVITVSDVRRIPAGDTGARYVKIGAEWIEFGATDGNSLTGCTRGARGTQAQRHVSGAAVHYGRSVIREYSLATFRDTYEDDLPTFGSRR